MVGMARGWLDVTAQVPDSLSQSRNAVQHNVHDLPCVPRAVILTVAVRGSICAKAGKKSS